jgi:hypothetical protein
MSTFTTEDRIEAQKLNAYRLADKIIEPNCYREYIVDAAMLLQEQASLLDKLIPQLVEARGRIEQLEIQLHGSR